MNKIGKLRIKTLSQLTKAAEDKAADSSTSVGKRCGRLDVQSAGSCEHAILAQHTTPKISGSAKKTRPAATTSKKIKERLQLPQTTKKSKTVRKELPPSQTKIDGFFKSCSKTYQIEKELLSTVNDGSCTKAKKNVDTPSKRMIKTRKTGGRGRKRLFENSSETETLTSLNCVDITSTVATRQQKITLRKEKSSQQKGGKIRVQESINLSECIDLCSEEETDVLVKKEHTNEMMKINIEPLSEQSCYVQQPPIKSSSLPEDAVTIGFLFENESTNTSGMQQQFDSARQQSKTVGDKFQEEKKASQETDSNGVKQQEEDSIQFLKMSLNVCARMEVKLKSRSVSSPLCNIFSSFTPTKPTTMEPSAKRYLRAGTEVKARRRKPRPCPPYKIVAGTTFAVDAFQFGPIEGVTHYFLTHFHADHYIGLTRKFSMPLYLSPITARLLRAFIPPEEKFLYEIELNQPQIIDGVEVTAIDANHCPGAIMLVFKLSTGKCMLHTGDFRASPNMESEPVFWNNNIDSIYLDTTYISNKYDLCTQDESICEAQRLIEEFQEKHRDKRILYISGAYLIGKEKFWSAIARKYSLVVWTEERRNKALKAIEDIDILDLLCTNPIEANMHVITMGKLSYYPLVEYFETYNSYYDICLAIRPSGWEKYSKPQYRGKINIIGVQYSEHSSHAELQRFITYLHPQEVISTVPVAGNLMITSKVPQSWYKYSKFPCQHRNFQPSITSYLKINKKTPYIEPDNSAKENHSPQSCLPNNLSTHVLMDADDDWLS